MGGRSTTSMRIMSLALGAVVLHPVAFTAGDGDVRYPEHVRTEEQRAAWRIGWPAYNGDGSFRAAVSGVDLVDDLRQAKLLWRSDEVTPIGKTFAARSGSFSAGRHGGTQAGKPSGGGSSPVVADGRVYLSYYVPTGPILPRGSGGARVGGGNDDARRVLADDVVLCLDACTGKTLWKKVFCEAGLNCQAMKSPGINGLTPVVAERRVFAMSTGTTVYALDARTGEVAWRAPLPGTDIKKIQQERLAPGWKGSLSHPYLPGKTNGKSLAYADGVVLVPGRGGLHAFDAATGKHLHTQGGLNGMETPPLWRHGGKTFVLTSGGGQVRCFDPRGGKTLWTIPNVAEPRFSIAVAGDILVGVTWSKHHKGKNRKGEEIPVPVWSAWKLTPGGGSALWSVDMPGSLRLAKGQPLAAGNHAYLPYRTASDGRGILCADLKTGTVVKDLPGPYGSGVLPSQWIEGRVLYAIDGSHMSITMGMVEADPTDFRAVGEPWSPPIPPTSGYYPGITHAYAAGFLFLRGADGIYCFDLRKRQRVGAR